MPPQDKDDASDHDLLMRIDERVLTIRDDVREGTAETKAYRKGMNTRVGKLETGQGALKDRMRWVSGIVTGAVGGVIGLFIKQA